MMFVLAAAPMLVIAQPPLALGQTPPSSTQAPAAEPVSIGTARMEADGTIVLQLIARDPGGARGEALLRYPPSHPDYARILRHVGPLRPGEERAVAPWPD
jgi:hypothetical protein